ncbi:hypothetical protein ES703_62671 [subsurface metagenome]
MAFHWKDNWYFARIGNGAVIIYHKDDHDIIDVDIEIDADSWASIVASVSAKGDTAEAFQEAREFHGGEKCSFCEEKTDRDSGGKLPDGWGKAKGNVSGESFDITFCPKHRKEAEEKLDIIFKVK